MDKDTFLSKITEIGTCEDDVQRRTLLAEVSDAVSQVYDDNTNHLTTIDTLNNTITANNERITKLNEANMSLYLRVTEQKSESQVRQDTTGIREPGVDKEKLTFEALFEKGGK